jgi:8-oxo-dGTP diphosphatase
MARKPIQAAGGIVVRGDRARPLVAVVQRSKDDRWVLPRGKLKRDENPAAGARREAVEETGHRVDVYEFLGAISYRARGRSKVVQFWRMHAAARPSRDVSKDIVAVEWLPLAAAVRRLSYPLERLFLKHVGRRVLKQRRRKMAPRKRARKTAKTHKKTAARRKKTILQRVLRRIAR